MDCFNHGASFFNLSGRRSHGIETHDTAGSPATGGRRLHFSSCTLYLTRYREHCTLGLHYKQQPCRWGRRNASMQDTQDAIRQGYRLTLSAYTYVDAARYACIPTQTVRNWFRGVYSFGHTMHPVFGEAPHNGLSYLQLVEVAFVAEMRRVQRLKLSALRIAYDHVRTELGVDYPFAQEQFLTDGTDL